MYINTPEIATQSWIHPDLFVDNSPIDGTGVFTRRPIKKHTIIIKWGGKIFNRAEILAGKAVPHSFVPIAPDYYIGALNVAEKSIDDYMNHSCDGVIGMFNETSLMVIGNIKAGQEITADYSIWTNDDDYVMKKKCQCRAKNCRGLITGKDWQIPKLQQKYLPYFSPLVKSKIINHSHT